MNSASTAAEASTALDGPDASSDVERLVGVGAAWKLGGQLGVQCIRLLAVVMLARLLRPEDYGVAAVTITLASFAPTIGDMGMGSALVQTDSATRTVRATAFWASVAFGSLISLIVIALAGPLGHFLGQDPRIESMVAMGGLTFVICSVGAPSQAMYTRQMKFRSIELRYWLGLAVASVLAVIAAASGLGPWALAVQQVALYTTFVIALWWRAGWHPGLEFSRSVFRSLGGFAIRIAGGRWARLIELLLLTLVIGKLVGVEALGAWTFAMSMVILPLGMIAIPIAEVLFSACSRLRGQTERIAALWLDSIRYLAAVILPLMVTLAAVAPDLIPVAFGAHWEVSVTIVQILCVYVVIRCLQAWGGVVLDALGKPHVTLWTQSVAAVTTPLGAVIGSHWGIEGIAVGFVASQLLAVEIPMLIMLLSELRVSPRTVAARLMRVVAAASVMALACVLARAGLSAFGVGMAGRAVLTIGVGLLVYASAIWRLAPDIRDRALGLVRRLPAKFKSARRSVGGPANASATQ